MQKFTNVTSGALDEQKMRVAEIKAQAQMNVGQVLGHYQTPEVAFIIPALQAAGVASGVALTAGLIAYWAQSPYPLRWAIGAWAVVFAVALVIFILSWRGSRNYLESLLHMDINLDGHIGQPPGPRRGVTFMEKGPGPKGTVQRYYEDRDERGAPLLDDWEWIELAHGLLTGVSFAQNKWCEGPEKLMSQDTFVKVQQTFVTWGWATWRNPKNPRQGVDLTGRGLSALQALVDGAGEQEEPPPPSISVS